MQNYHYFFTANILAVSSHSKLKNVCRILPHKIVLLLINVPCSCEYPTQSLFENIFSLKGFSLDLERKSLV